MVTDPFLNHQLVGFHFQELALRNPAVQNHQLPNQIRTDGQSIETSSEMTTATDPFLGQNHTNDLHTRQESADSGLGKQTHCFTIFTCM